MTQQDIIYKIHKEYALAGADIIEINSFNGTQCVQKDYGTEQFTYEMNKAAGTLAKKAADEVTKETGKKKYVAGAVGPTSKTLSVSKNVEDPSFRDVTFQEMV